MTKESHQRFHEWLAAGAEGEPPRDLAVHASVCAGCQESIAAFDRLAMIDSSRATVPGRKAAPAKAGPAASAPMPIPARPMLSPAAPPSATDIKPMPTRVTTLTAGNLAARIGAAPIPEAPVGAPPVNPPPPGVAAGGDEGGRRRRGRVAVLAVAAVFGAVILGFGVTQAIGLFRNGGPIAQATPTPDQSGFFTNTPQPSESFTPPETTSPMESVTAIPTPVATAIPTPIPTPKPTAPPKPGSPGAPTGLTAVASIGKITLHWSAPASNGGSPITGYDIYRDGSDKKLYSTTAPTLTEGVGNGGTHVYRVTAVNKVGAGPYSNPASATTPNVPGAPGTVTATGGNGQVAVTWTAPASNGGSAITEYDVYKDGGSTPICAGTSQPCTNAGLGDGESHIYTVKARNAVGLGPGTADVGTAWNKPGLPTSVVAAGGNGSIGITWSPPASDGGSAVTGYDVYREDMGSTPVCSISGFSCTDSGLTPGESHTYTVKASNVIGQGLGASDVGTAWNKPGAFTLMVAASVTPGQIDLTWTTPAPNGSAITQYEIYYSPTSFITLVPNGTNSYSDALLTSGNTYAYYVVAVNAVGSTSSNVDSTTAP
jgi:hypothetical protein